MPLTGPDVVVTTDGQKKSTNPSLYPTPSSYFAKYSQPAPYINTNVAYYEG